MGTKKNPGKFDCYKKVQEDEPFFVLRAKDPTAPFVVRQWARLNEPCQSPDKIEEAMNCANAMEVWKRKEG